MDYAEKVNVQVDFFAKLLHFIGRQAPYRGVEGLPETALGDLSFINKVRATFEKVLAASPRFLGGILFRRSPQKARAESTQGQREREMRGRGLLSSHRH